jgi:membrane-associated phospholipid phosphatase
MAVLIRAALASLLFFPALEAPCKTLTFDPLGDGLALGMGAGATLVGEIVLQGQLPADLGAPDVSSINWVDRQALFPYSGGLDIASTVLEAGSCAVPLLFALVLPEDELLAVAASYGEALACADTFKNLIKFLVPRYRPYVYTGGAQGVPPAENTLSFPSGHTTMSFTTAAFGTFVFAAYFPSSPFLVPFAVGSFSLAAVTATFRVLSGMHFVTDVATGLVAGLACGILVPLLHLENANETEDISLSFIPNGVGFNLRF